MVEKDGLADTAESGEDDAAFGSFPGDPFEDHLERGELLLAAGELGRALSRARGVRVADRIHPSMLTASSSDSELI